MTTPERREPATLRVAFTASCRAPGATDYGYFWRGDKAHEHRLDTANYCFALDIDRDHTRLTPRRIYVVGQFTITADYHRQTPLTAADGIGTITAWLQWTLSQVYGVERNHYLGIASVPLPDLKVTIREIRVESETVEKPPNANSQHRDIGPNESP